MGACQESRLFPGRGSIVGCTFPRARRIPWHRVWEICPKLRNGHRWPTSAVSVDSRGEAGRGVFGGSSKQGNKLVAEICGVCIPFSDLPFVLL